MAPPRGASDRDCAEGCAAGADRARACVPEAEATWKFDCLRSCSK